MSGSILPAFSLKRNDGKFYDIYLVNSAGNRISAGSTTVIKEEQLNNPSDELTRTAKKIKDLANRLFGLDLTQTTESFTLYTTPDSKFKQTSTKAPTTTDVSEDNLKQEFDDNNEQGTLIKISLPEFFNHIMAELCNRYIAKLPKATMPDPGTPKEPQEGALLPLIPSSPDPSSSPKEGQDSDAYTAPLSEG